MVPQQPCVDKYGSDICHLQRFHLGRSVVMRGNARKPQTSPKPPPTISKPDSKPPTPTRPDKTPPKPTPGGRPSTPKDKPSKPGGKPSKPGNKPPGETPDPKKPQQPTPGLLPTTSTPSVPVSTGSALRPPRLVQFEKSVEELSPDMRARARLIEAGYRMKEAYDITLHNTEEGNYR